MAQHTEVPDVTIVRDTGKALLCKLEEGEQIWVPKSVVDFDSSEAVDVGDKGTLVVASWFAKKTDELVGYVD